MNGEISLDGESTQEAPTTENQTTETQAPEAKAADTTEQPPAKADDEPQGAPIASKSGAYTIPYEKLEQARERAKTVEAENEALKAQIADLTSKQQANLEQAQEQAQARAQAGSTPNQADQNLQAAQDALSKGVDPAIFGNFDEEGIAKGIQTLLAQTVPVIREQLKAELEKEIAPLKAERAKAQADSHMGAIYAKHADANEIADSSEFKAWVQSLPTYARAGVEHAMGNGTTDQVIEVFDSFKARAGAKPPATQTQAPEVQRRVPASLSEVNGAPPMDILQQTLQAANNPESLLDRMASMTPEQVNALMDRI